MAHLFRPFSIIQSRVALVVLVFLALLLVLTSETTSAEDEVASQFKGRYDEFDSTMDVVVSGDYAYLTDDDGFLIVDISDKTDPQLVGSYDTDDEPRGIAIDGDYAYVADREGGLVVLSIDEKANPQRIGSCATVDAWELQVSGSYVFVADSDNGLVIVDISDKTDPKQIGHHDTLKNCRDIALAGDYAYLAASEEGLIIVDISDKTNPSEVGTYDTTGSATGICLAGDFAYIADADNGLVIVDISDKTDPEEAGHLGTSDRSYDVVVSGAYAFLANWNNGVVIANITDRENPTTAGHCEILGSSVELTLTANHIYVATMSRGLSIVELIPVAHIDSVSHIVAIETEQVTFEGRGTGTQPIERYVWRSSLDGELHNSTTESGFSSSSLSLGAHTINLSVQDSVGAWSLEASTTVTVHQRPVAQIDSISPNPVLDSEKVTFSGSGIDDGEIEKYVWRLNDDEYYNDTESSFGWWSLPPDSYTVYFQVQDNRGVWSEEISTTLIVHSKPTVKGVEIEPDPALTTDTIKIKVLAEDDGEIARYVCRNDSEELYNGTEEEFELGGLDPGNHNLFIKVQDNHGVWSEESSADLKVHARPTAEIKSLKPNPVLSTDSIMFTGNGEDDGEVVRYLWRTDLEELYNGTEDEFELDNLSRGSYTIYLQVQDNDGAWSEEISIELTVHSRPTVVIDEIEPDSALTTDTVKLKAEAEDDGEVVRYLWWNETGELYNGTENEFDLQNLNPGNHTIYLKVQDNHGVWSEETSRYFSVHLRPTATIVSILPGTLIEGEEVSFSGEGSDDGTVVKYLWISSLDGELHNGSESGFSTTGLSIGNHTIHFQVLDDQGVWSEEVSTTLEVKEDVPPENKFTTVTITNPLDSTTLTGIVNIKGSASDEDGTVEKVDVLVDGEWFTVTGITSWEFELDTTSLDNGEYQIKVLAFDGEDYSNDTVITVNVENVVENPKDNDEDSPGFEAGFFALVLLLTVVPWDYSGKQKT